MRRPERQIRSGHLIGAALILPFGLAIAAGAFLGPVRSGPFAPASSGPPPRHPDALGASLARSVAERSQLILHLASNAAARAACTEAIGVADAASLRAAEVARGRSGNAQDLPMVLASEDLYLNAARSCIRDARLVCERASRRLDGCEQIAAVTDSALASIDTLRAVRLR